MQDATESRSQGKRATLFGTACGLACAGLVWLLGANIQTLAGLCVVAAGLLQLFPLAAWGPKTQERRKNRVRAAGAAVVMVIVGEAMLISDLKVKATLLAMGAVGVTGMFAQIPRRFFEAQEASSSTFDDPPNL